MDVIKKFDMSPLCPSKDEQRLRLAAATAATATTFAFFTIAIVVKHVQFVQGSHLLSKLTSTQKIYFFLPIATKMLRGSTFPSGPQALQVPSAQSTSISLKPASVNHL